VSFITPPPPSVSAAPSKTAAPASTAAGCGLANGIKHVIYIQFDNVHYTRDNSNVPSDLEQMPNLLNFITGNGTLISHEHTPLIAHTADRRLRHQLRRQPGQRQQHQPDRPERQDAARPVGRLHPGRLQRRLGRRRQHRTGEPGPGRGQRLRRELGGRDVRQQLE
jgi:hypothetical protein